MIGSPTNPHKKTVLVTRPQYQAERFSVLLQKNGYVVQAFPSIEICSVNFNQQLEQKMRSINSYDLIIFISANAVLETLNFFKPLEINPAEITSQIATIGRATQEAAINGGFNVSLSPKQGFNSEALLALDALQTSQIKGSHCLIVRGVGGLENLAEELRNRGARVDYAQVYQRRKPVRDHNIERQQLTKNWSRFGIDAITVSSNESLQNLYDMLELSSQSTIDRALILNTLLIMPSKRGVALAKSLGFKCIHCAQSAINQHMLDALDKVIG